MCGGISPRCNRRGVIKVVYFWLQKRILGVCEHYGFEMKGLEWDLMEQRWKTKIKDLTTNISFIYDFAYEDENILKFIECLMEMKIKRATKIHLDNE